MTVPGSGPILRVQSVSRRFTKRLDLAAKVANFVGAGMREEVVRAVDKVDLEVMPGEVMGLVGESGCGKSTLGRIVAGILEPSDGSVLYRGQPVVVGGSGAAARKAALAVQMIFQDPFASLNPRMRVRDIIGEAPRVHRLINGNFEAYVDEVMRRVGLDPSYKRRYPHQFSGGQRQRIGIARALAVKPEFIVCDEAVAALDVSIQAQILNLFIELRKQLNLTYLFISHDLGVVRHLADRVAIMYLGRIVEQGQAEDVFDNPNHPYTQALIAEIPRLDTRKRQFVAVKGEIPSPLDPPPGCHFHPRCPHAMPRCKTEVPKLKVVAPGRLSACHLNDGR